MPGENNPFIYGKYLGKAGISEKELERIFGYSSIGGRRASTDAFTGFMNSFAQNISEEDAKRISALPEANRIKALRDYVENQEVDFSQITDAELLKNPLVKKYHGMKLKARLGDAVNLSNANNVIKSAYGEQYSTEQLNDVRMGKGTISISIDGKDTEVNSSNFFDIANQLHGRTDLHKETLEWRDPFAKWEMPPEPVTRENPAFPTQQTEYPDINKPRTHNPNFERGIQGIQTTNTQIAGMQAGIWKARHEQEAAARSGEVGRYINGMMHDLTLAANALKSELANEEDPQKRIDAGNKWYNGILTDPRYSVEGAADQLEKEMRYAVLQKIGQEVDLIVQQQNHEIAIKTMQVETGNKLAAIQAQVAQGAMSMGEGLTFSTETLNAARSVYDPIEFNKIAQLSLGNTVVGGLAISANTGAQQNTDGNGIINIAGAMAQVTRDGNSAIGYIAATYGEDIAKILYMDVQKSRADAAKQFRAHNTGIFKEQQEAYKSLLASDDPGDWEKAQIIAGQYRGPLLENRGNVNWVPNMENWFKPTKADGSPVSADEWITNNILPGLNAYLGGGGAGDALSGKDALQLTFDYYKSYNPDMPDSAAWEHAHNSLLNVLGKSSTQYQKLHELQARIPKIGAFLQMAKQSVENEGGKFGEVDYAIRVEQAQQQARETYLKTVWEVLEHQPVSSVDDVTNAANSIFNTTGALIINFAQDKRVQERGVMSKAQIERMTGFLKSIDAALPGSADEILGGSPESYQGGVTSAMTAETQKIIAAYGNGIQELIQMHGLTTGKTKTNVRKEDINVRIIGSDTIVYIHGSPHRFRYEKSPHPQHQLEPLDDNLKPIGDKKDWIKIK